VTPYITTFTGARLHEKIILSHSIIMVAKVRNYKKSYKKRAQPINKIVKSEIKKALNSTKFVEFKRNRSLIAATAVAGTEVFTNLLVANVQGLADISNRVGDQITLKDIRLRGHTTWSGLGTDTCRVVLFLWHLDLGVTPPTAALLLDDVATTNTKLHSALSYDNKKAFTVLYDNSFHMSADTSGRVFDKTFKLSDKIAQGVGNNSFSVSGFGVPYLMYVSNATTTFINYMTVRYTDM